MKNPQPSKLKISNSYSNLGILLIAGTAVAFGIVWVLSQFHRVFPGFQISLTQELIISVVPVFIGVIKWILDRFNQLRQFVERNSLEIIELHEQSKDLLQTTQRLDKSSLWNQVQIENIYSRLEELEDKD